MDNLLRSTPAAPHVIMQRGEPEPASPVCPACIRRLCEKPAQVGAAGAVRWFR
ncbi:hypothetical protein C8Q76DRAFT_713326 [Earliella scabrosa]|nr:hypothetical protein C8Q76DRAFT_713326 [Earliella scabrosa]